MLRLGSLPVVRLSSSVVRTLLWYRRGPGFDSPLRLVCIDFPCKRCGGSMYDATATQFAYAAQTGICHHCNPITQDWLDEFNAKQERQRIEYNLRIREACPEELKWQDTAMFEV